MDQGAFRALLSTSAPAPAAAPAYKSVAQRKEAQASKPDGKKSEFKPRNALKGKGKAKAEEPEPLKKSLDDDRGTLARPTRGLDRSLLEQQKLEKEREAEAAVEDDLEALFEGRVVEEEAPAPVRKSREQILAELAEQQKASRGGDLAQAKAEGRFKRVGEKAKASSTLVASPDVKIDPKTGKKLRKKKKAPASDVAAPATGMPKASASTPKATEAPVWQPVPVASTSGPVAPPQPVTLEPEVEADEDADIFGDAGDYDPFASDGEERPAVAAGQLPVKLFDDDEEIRADPISAPAQRPASAALPADEEAVPRRRRRDSDSEEDSPPARLQGFADGADVKSLLAMDNDAIKDEKKKERKERKRALAAGEAPPEKKQKKLTDADKLNRDFIEYSNYVAAQEK